MNIKEPSNDSATEALWTTPVLGAASLVAIVSASCCVLPIGLSIAGLGGTWLTVLEPFVAYRSIILIGVGLVLVMTWARLIRRRDRCDKRLKAARIFATFCTVVFIAALSVPLWEPDAVRAMLSYWRGSW